MQSRHRPPTKEAQILHRVADNLYKSSVSGIYYGICQVGKQQFRKSLKTRSRSVADNALRQWLGKVGRLNPTEGRNQPFGSIAYRYLADRQHVLAQSTIKRLLLTIRTLEGIFGPVAVSRLTEDHIRSWKTQREPGEKVSERSFNMELEVIRSTFAEAIRRGLVVSDPSAWVKRARIRHKALDVPSKAEFQALINQLRKTHADSQAADLVALLAYSGMRLGEATSLCWRDVDFKLKQARVAVEQDETDEDGIKTESSRRQLPMNPALLTHLLTLQSRREVAKPDDTVITIHSARKGLQTACEALWEDPHKYDRHHCFRHFFATTCIEAGVDIPTVARWLGHKDGGALAMKTYGHLRAQHSHAQAKKVRF